jgi:hypothetical protein
MRMLVHTDKQNIVKAIIYFFLATVISWFFIIQSPMYVSKQQQFLSGSIAGAKWAIQIIGGWQLLQGKKWLFIQKTGFTCLVGSLLLLPYCFSSFLKLNNSPAFFFASLVLAVLVMIVSYYQNVTHLDIGLHWWLLWLVCLTIAVSLQLTIVFHIIKL